MIQQFFSHIYLREMKTCLLKVLHKNVHSSFIYKKLEIIQVSINRRLDKLICYIHAIEYYSAVKKTDRNMDESRNIVT